jgi:hypothetical protein
LAGLPANMLFVIKKKEKGIFLSVIAISHICYGSTNIIALVKDRVSNFPNTENTLKHSSYHYLQYRQ